MHEMRENMYCAKIPTFTVQLCIYVNLVSVSVSEWYCNYSVSSKLITRIPNYSLGCVPMFWAFLHKVTCGLG